LNFFGVASPDQFEQSCLKTVDVAFRRSTAFSADRASVAAWLRKGELEARQIACAPYDEARFTKALGRIRALTTEPPEVFQPEAVRECRQSGVALAFVRALPRTRASGATRWLTPSKALIQLSLRYKSDDQLWFSFFHEAGHIVKHGKTALFLDTEPGVPARGGDPKEAEADRNEAEADRFAANMLIRPENLRRFTRGGDYSRQAIVRFAHEIGIAAGIVVGRLQHDKILRYNQQNALKRRLDWAQA